MFHRFMLITALLVYASIHSSLAMAITSVCSGPLPSDEGGGALRHEATWTLHDNWFHNLSVQMSSAAQGPVSAAREDTVALGLGGQHLHQLAEPDAGHYTVQGQLHIGYPLAWGFDAYYTVACEPWHGEITPLLAETDADAEADSGDLSDQTLDALAGIDLDAWLEGICANASQQALCEQVRALSADERQVLAERMSRLQFPLHRVTGFIAAMDEREIIIRTTAGHYGRFDLAEQVTLTRHTQALYASVQADDWVQVQRAPSAEREARVWVFRDGTEELPDYRGSGQFDQRVELPDDTIVTVIEPAQFRELQPIISYVRVVASVRDDGRLEVQRIEVLR